MSSLQEQVEAKLVDVQGQLKVHSEKFSEVSTSIDKLAAEKLTLSNNLHILNGALQAYTDVLNILKNINEEVVIVEENG